MKKKIISLGVVILLFIVSLHVATISYASVEPITYDTEQYKVIKSYSDNEVIFAEDATLSLTNANMLNSKTGEVAKIVVQEAKTEKLYDLVNKETGEQATHYRSDIKLYSQTNQASDSGNDAAGGLVFYETLYYTSTQKNLIDYVLINKIDYRFEKQDSNYKVTSEKMDIYHIGVGIHDNQYKNQTKTINLNTSGTILTNNFGWVATRTGHELTRLGTKTTATIQRGQSSSWEFSFSMNPR